MTVACHPGLTFIIMNENILTQYATPPTNQPPKTAWLVAPPASGSTWLSRMLIWSFRWRTGQIIPRGFARREQEISIPRGWDAIHDNVFLPHHHSKASEPTMAFIKAYRVNMLILTRDLADNTVALIDHLTNDGVGIPNGYIPLSFKKESFDTRAEIVISMILPWYISFYASWAYAEADEGIKPCYISYERLVSDTMPELARCLTHCNEQRNVNVYNLAIKKGAEREQTRFNKGKPGRGANLPTQHRKEILRLCEIHQDPIIHNALTRDRKSVV